MAHLEHEHDDHLSHVMSPRILVGTFAGLIALTVLTVWAARQDVGNMDIVVAMAIACAKASLVAVFFMHLKHDRALNSLFLVGAFIFVMLFVLIAALDAGIYISSVEEAPLPPVETHAAGH
jgi:cytochrome c oxidase subunit 4